MTMATIKQALEQLDETEFPVFPEDDALSDWVGELAEFDGYVAGLAMSASGGAKVDVRQLSEQAKRFREAFAQLPTSYAVAEDNAIYSACNRYLELIEALVMAIVEQGNS